MPKGVYKHRRGFVLSEDTKNKIRDKAKKRVLSEDIRRKISQSLKKIRKGKDNPMYGRRLNRHWNWQGGKSFEPYSIDWTETLRRSIRERDNYICQLCSQYGNAVHHIDYDKTNCNPKNLINLCMICNSRVNKNRNYWRIYFVKELKGSENYARRQS